MRVASGRLTAMTTVWMVMKGEERFVAGGRRGLLEVKNVVVLDEVKPC